MIYSTQAVRTIFNSIIHLHINEYSFLCKIIEKYNWFKTRAKIVSIERNFFSPCIKSNLNFKTIYN